MQKLNQHSRVNLAELKTEIVKRIGVDRSKLYFYYLNKLLSLKLNKVEFNKLCYRVLGKENVPLHNHFICSILKNACNAKVSPPLLPSSYSKEVTTSTSDGSFCSPIGKVGVTFHQSAVTVDNISLEQGKQKLVQHHQEELLLDAEKEGEGLSCHPSKLPLIKQSTDGLLAVHSKDENAISLINEGKELSTITPLQAPLGIPFCTTSAGGAHRSRPLAGNDGCTSSYETGGLLDTQALCERMQLIAAAQGLVGVSMDSANLLNNGLDAYLKRLIKSCIELADAKGGYDLMKNSTHKHPSKGNLVNGFSMGHNFFVQSSSKLLDGMQEQIYQFPISLLDFKVAMELNPQQLGEDWPLLLEKICTHAFEE